MRLEGKRALITGAAKGLGLAIALRFLREGARVMLVDIDGNALGTALDGAQAGEAALSHVASVTDDEAVSEAVAAAMAAWGGLDILVNNAGIAQRPAAAMKADPEEIDRIFAVNVRGLFHVTRHALPALREAKGSIINLASNAALRPRPGMAWYNASKAAVMNLTQTMAAEYAPHVRVNAIAPSLADTPMKDFIVGDNAAQALPAVLASIPMGRLCEGDDIASAATYLASDDASFVTGVILPVDGGRMVG